MPVTVDESGHHDGVAGVDDLGVGARQAEADGRDALAFNQHVCAVQCAPRAIHGQDVAAPDE